MNEHVGRLFVRTDVARPMAAQTLFLDILTRNGPHQAQAMTASVPGADADACGAIFGFDQLS